MMTSTQLSNTEPYLTIHADGRITVSEKLKPSETAARVLECIKTQWMEDSQSKQIRELQDCIKRMEEDSQRLNWLLNRGLAWRDCYNDWWKEGEWLYASQSALQTIDKAKEYKL